MMTARVSDPIVQAAPLTVAVISYNTREHLRACLTTVVSEARGQIIVVDNASSDGSVEMVRTEFPQVKVEANESNLGYGAAANRAIAECSSDYVLLLNSDTLLQPGALQALGAYLDQQPSVAIVGPRLMNPDGTLQPSCYPFPTPFNVFLEESSLGRLVRRIPFLRQRYLRTWSHSRAMAVPWVLGAALAIRREAFSAICGFDEAYFMYFEEVDLCYRLYAAGWQVHFAPVTTVVHVGGASTRQHEGEMTRRVFASAGEFYRRHYSAWGWLRFKLVVGAVMRARIMRDMARIRWTRDLLQRRSLTENLLAWHRILDDLEREGQ